jgi:hypothetical protein
LQDVRHSYVTAGSDAKIDWKVLGDVAGDQDQTPCPGHGGQEA